jgi:anti-sigma regulatory factor (Ser/Thr protein kinase)
MAIRRTVTITRGLEELPRVIETVEDFCQGVGASEHDSHSLHLAIEEVVSNVLMHGYRGAPYPVSVCLEAIPTGRVRATVTDRAPAYDPLARPEVDTKMPLEDRPIGGLGVHLVKKLMDTTHYERVGDQNVFAMELALNGEADGVAGN